MELHPILRYPGGKTRLRKELLQHVPEHKTYVEPFVGGGSLFFGKKPADKAVISDINEPLVKFYKTVPKLENGISCNFKDKQSKEAFEKEKEREPEGPLDRVCNFLYLNKCSYGGKQDNFAKNTCVRNGKQVGIKRFGKNIDKYKERLGSDNVEILNKDYKTVIEEYDSPNTFFYLDPPYLGPKDVYDYDEIDHEELKEILENVKGKWLLSIDNHPKIKELYKDFDQKVVSFRYTLGDNRDEKKELLIANYDLNSPDLGNPISRRRKMVVNLGGAGIFYYGLFKTVGIDENPWGLVEMFLGLCFMKR